jgi:hypothetical protein
MALQAKVGLVQSASSSAVNWHMKRDAAARAEARGGDIAMVSQLISKAMTGGNTSDMPSVQRYTPEELSKMNTDREISACQMMMSSGDEPAPKKKLITDAMRMDMSGLLHGIVKRSSALVQGETLTAEALARNQEIQSLSKKYGLQVAIAEALWFKFDQLDTSGDGALNHEEFTQLLKWVFKDCTVTDQAAKKLWNEFDGSVDKVKDGGVSFEEFLVWFVRKVPSFMSLTPTQLKHYISDL